MAGIEYQHNNSGPGDQFLAAGSQNNNSGSGAQYNAHNINFNAPQDSDANLFADLCITDPRHDKDRIENTKGGLLRDSYRWILGNPDFQTWRKDSDKRLLWVKGDPGKGKTMLLCGLINELADEGAEPVYFFCQAADSRLNSATAVLRGLMYLLLKKRPSLVRFVREQYEHAGKRLFEDVNSWTALSKILVKMLAQENEAMGKVVLVIDALDECTTNLDELLDLVIRFSSTSTKLVVSSRNWPNIEEAMKTAEQQCPICLELNEASISAAVLTYTKYKVSQPAKQKSYDPKLRDAVQSYLASNSDGTFLWVSIVAQRLRDRGWLYNLETPVYERGYPAWATSENSILAVAARGHVYFFSILTGNRVGEAIQIGARTVSSMAFAPNGAVLATASTEGAIHLWNIQTREYLGILQGSNNGRRFRLLVFSLNGLYIAAAVDEIIMVWDLNTGLHLQTLIGHEGSVLAVAFFPDDYHIQSASSDGSVKMWNLEGHSCLSTVKIPVGRHPPVICTFSRDGAKFACRDRYDGPVVLCETTTGRHLGTVEHVGDARALAISPDDTVLMSGTLQDGVKLWDLTDVIEPNVMPLSQENQRIYAMAFSFDGTQLAVFSGDALRIWDANKGQCLWELTEWRVPHSSCEFWEVAAAVTFGNNGILLAMIAEGSGEDVAEIWDVRTAMRLQSLADGRISKIRGLEFSPDSATLAILTHDIISLWDVGDGSCRVVYNSPAYTSPESLRFSLTGSHLYDSFGWEDGALAIRLESQIAADAMEISVAPREHLFISGYKIQKYETWVTKDGKRIIWIPPQYRTGIYATWGRMMALGYESGRVIFLRFA
ncbi:Vegetative incompatibility protein HET-E-1 [Colletotrichum siamense]|nr:Vegetative incompatibility protein HET-E-1 [Colletotrichum siamense]